MTSRPLAWLLAVCLLVGFVPISRAVAADTPAITDLTPGRAQPLTVHGVVRGDQTAAYRVKVFAGQTLDVSLRTGGTTVYFNVTPAGANESMFIGSTSGGTMRRMVPMDGWYHVDVYLMRATARRGASRAFAFTLAIAGDPLKPLPGVADALVAGTPFHATAQVTCSAPFDTVLAQCPAGVIRRDPQGSATVAVSLPHGARHVLFVRGQLAASDAALPVVTSREGDATTLRFGSGESFQIPDALLTGG